MSDFVYWSKYFATDKYLTLFYSNYFRIKEYGCDDNGQDFDLVDMLRVVPKNVSHIPYESRNSDQYFELCPDERVLIGDFSICEKLAEEFIEVAELCASPCYYMSYNQKLNACPITDKIEFEGIRERARKAGVSLTPFETKRSKDYATKIAFLLHPIAKYC